LPLECVRRGVRPVRLKSYCLGVFSLRLCAFALGLAVRYLAQRRKGAKETQGIIN
jgi:hypothetical protein